jgi:hypothetical protein
MIQLVLERHENLSLYADVALFRSANQMMCA